MRKLGYITNSNEPHIPTSSNTSDVGATALATLTNNYGIQNDTNSL